VRLRKGSIQEGASDLDEVFLRPGEVHVAQVPTRIVTVLGSCVAVTLCHPGRRIGAMCHGIFPGKDGHCPDDPHEMFRFVDCSVRNMVRTFGSLGIPTKEIQTKVFGGAEMLGRSPQHDRGGEPIGVQNVNAALVAIERYGLIPMAQDVGGIEGRKIIFFNHTGEVLLKRVRPGRLRE